MKIAEALLLRKTLTAKLAKLELFKRDDLFEVSTRRVQIKEGEIEEVTTHVPKLSLKDVMKEYNDLSKKIRQLDAAVQKANWDSSVDLPEGFEKEE